MVHSILEYSCPILDPNLRGDIDKLEGVQELAARFAKSDYSFTSKVAAMLNGLGWGSLADRQIPLRYYQVTLFVNSIISGSCFNAIPQEFLGMPAKSEIDYSRTSHQGLMHLFKK